MTHHPAPEPPEPTLRELVAAAGEGEWHTEALLQGHGFDPEDAAFIAAANPTAVLALLRRLRDRPMQVRALGVRRVPAVLLREPEASRAVARAMQQLPRGAQVMCKWDRERGEYLVDGEPCKRDDYGDPTRHCTAKRSCSHHVGFAELTCGRCLGDVRNDIRAVRDFAALMPYEALSGGVNSEAANLAGPAADYAVFSARRGLDRRWIMAHIPEANLERAMRNLLPDDDEWHPYSVLTRWHLMLAEDYGHTLPARMSTTGSATYLDRHLHLVAQDEAQDFPLLRSEVRKCRQHLEAVLHNSQARPRGVPCPTCVEEGKPVVRLELEHGHFCEDEDCERVNYATDEGDKWVCPRNRLHWWTAKAYRDYLEERSA